MRKFITSIFLLAVFLIPKYVFAQTQALDLPSTLNDEKIDLKFDNYKEADKAVTVYLFRGAGCIHCHDFLEFLNEFAMENGNLFKLRSFEVYNNPDNQALKKRIVDYFGDRAGGVPYIIIGNKTYYGFAKDDGSTIEEAIKEEYGKEKRFDIFDEIDNQNSTSSTTTSTKTNNEKQTNSRTLTIIILIIVMVLIVLMSVSNTIFKKMSGNKSK